MSPAATIRSMSRGGSSAATWKSQDQRSDRGGATEVIIAARARAGPVNRQKARRAEPAPRIPQHVFRVVPFHPHQAESPSAVRMEERRVGIAGGGSCCVWWWRDHFKKK